jgi:Malectin-like domain
MQDGWTNISTSSTVDTDEDFATPSHVMQTAATTSSTKQPLDLLWTWDNKSTMFYVILHASEIQNIPSTALRVFDILADGWLLFNSTSPPKLKSRWYSYTDTNGYEYNVSLKATSNSTLPPLLNAIELYTVTPAFGIPTNDGDGTFHQSTHSMFFIGLT